MAFTPKSGYSDKRSATVFADGENNQRADFTYNLDSNWTTEKFSEDQSSLVFTNGKNKQRAIVVYNIGNSSGGGSGSGDVTSVNGKTGAVVLSGDDINSTVTGNGSAVTDTITNHLQTLKNDQEANGTQIHEIEAKIPQSASEDNQLATKAEITSLNNKIDTKQDIIDDLDTIRSGATAGSTAVQPAAIADMETKSNASATYQLKGDYALSSELPESKTGTAGQVYTKTADGAEWKTISGSGTNAGIKGDYFATWGWMEGSNGLPTIVSGSNNIKIPAGTILMCLGSDGYITISGDTTFENDLTEDFTLFYARNLDGTGAGFIAATDVVWSDTEPEPNGQTGFQAWKKSGTSNWQLRSNDSGNVWREVVGTPIADAHYTDGTLTRLDFDGYRQFNKQEYLKTSGGTIFGTLALEKSTGSQRAEFTATDGNSVKLSLGTTYKKDAYTFGYYNFTGTVELGSSTQRWSKAHIVKLNNGADIAVPTTGGMMVVATPPATAGNYVLKATVAEDGTVTTQWVAEV